eukprot:scaffold627_cov125-Cylindrotheca_fusiformis.AAC.4
MFKLGRRRKPNATAATTATSSGKSPSKKNVATVVAAGTDANDNDDSLKRHHDEDGEDGIEVSLDAYVHEEESREPPIPSRMERQPVIDVQELIQWKKQVFQRQFSLVFPAPPAQASLSAPNIHRIPLASKPANNKPRLSFQQTLQMLEASNPVLNNEYTAVAHEIQELTMEMKSIQQDKLALEKQHQHQKMNNTTTTATGTNFLAAEQIRLLLPQGNCLTIRFQSFKTKEVFLSKCGSSKIRPTFRNCVTLGPKNTHNGVISRMQHITLMSSNGNSTTPTKFKTSFFWNFLDDGDDYSKDFQMWGRWPSPKLLEMANNNKKVDKKEGNENKGIQFLSTGPQGLYFVQFQGSQECWWKIPEEDHELQSILESWDGLHRVVFGPMEAMDNARGTVTTAYSWIVLGANGQVAWKNLPTRLHNRLSEIKEESDNAVAPVEVSLGPGGSYFVRFLDGSIDYCLSAEMATVCDHIQDRGGKVTYIALHPEISHDFVIRHTELSSL